MLTNIMLSVIQKGLSMEDFYPSVEKMLNFGRSLVRFWEVISTVKPMCQFRQVEVVVILARMVVM